MTIDVKVLAAVFSASINLILIIFVSLRNRRHILYRSFVLLCFCLLMWNLRVIVSRNFPVSIAHPVYAALIIQIFYTAVTACLYVLPVAALQFTAVFIGLDSRAIRNIISYMYFAAFGLSIVYALDIFSAATYNYILWIFTLPVFSASLLLIGRSYSLSARPLERRRFGLLLIAGAIGITGAIAEDILTTAGVHAGGLGNVSNVAYSLIVATCLFRHQLFDIQVTARRTLSAAISAVMLLSVSYLLSLIFHPIIPLPYVYVFITALLLLLFGRRVVTLSEKILFGKSRYLSQTLNEIRYSLDRAASVNELLKITAHIAQDNLGINRCTCICRNEMTGQYQYYWPPSAEIEQVIKTQSFSDLAAWIDSRHSDEPLVYDELCHLVNFGGPDQTGGQKIAQVLADMKTVGYEVYSPLMLDHQIEGMMCLGEKTNGQAFVGSDVRFAKLLSYNCVLRFQHLKMLERMRQLERLAALGEMAAYVAHEVKNPLTIIRSAAQIMKSEDSDFRGSSIIIEECDRLNRVITRMLDFTKEARPAPRRINAANKIRKWSEELVQSNKSKQLRLSVECPTKFPSVRFDPDHLRQIIDNILLNAIEAMPNGGKIDIGFSQENNCVKVVIADSGPGIRHQDKGDIHRAFYTTKPGGSGLGLPITDRLLALNSGSMVIDSQPHKGCTVTLRIPKWRKRPC